MILGYNTNGFAHHRLEDAIEIIAELGYLAVAYTPDVNHLSPYFAEKEPDPYRLGYGKRLEEFRRRLDRVRLRCVIETGARYLLDPRIKHGPPLITSEIGPMNRYRFLHDMCNVARGLGSDTVSFWSGQAPPDMSYGEAMGWLAFKCHGIALYAAQHNIRLAFEPEPGMFIDTMDKFAELHAKVNHPNFGLTIDVGHLVCNGELPVSQHLVAWKDWLWNVHIEDMVHGVHDHLMFGEGEVDFDDVFAGLKAAEYEGIVSVELSRHSHDAVNTARKSMEFLKPYLERYGG